MEVGDDQRDRLRRLVAQEDADLLRRRAAQELERPALDRRREAADDLRRALGAQRALEQRARVVDAALGDVVVGHHGLDRLVDHLAGHLGGDLARLGDLERERLDLGRREVAEDLARALLAERDEQDGGLLRPAQAAQVARCGRRPAGAVPGLRRPSVLAHPRADLGGHALGLTLDELLEG